MKKTTVNVTVFKYGHPAVLQVEGWILKHRLDDTIQLAAVRRSFEEDNQDRWNITELSTGFKVAGNFRTRQEAEQYLEDSYADGQLSPEKFQYAIGKSQKTLRGVKEYQE